VQVQEFEQEAVQMEERPEETPIDEEQDVEGHKHHSPTVPAPTIAREDEGDDVEAHGNVAAPTVPAPTVGHEDEDDDVEAHAHFPAPGFARPNNP
jgi:hypothetical protein